VAVLSGHPPRLDKINQGSVESCEVGHSLEKDFTSGLGRERRRIDDFRQPPQLAKRLLAIGAGAI
jgi:hypothetical protein